VPGGNLGAKYDAFSSAEHRISKIFLRPHPSRRASYRAASAGTRMVATRMAATVIHAEQHVPDRLRGRVGSQADGDHDGPDRHAHERDKGEHQVDHPAGGHPCRRATSATAITAIPRPVNKSPAMPGRAGMGLATPRSPGRSTTTLRRPGRSTTMPGRAEKSTTTLRRPGKSTASLCPAGKGNLVAYPKYAATMSAPSTRQHRQPHGPLRQQRRGSWRLGRPGHQPMRVTL
jgi:hypothetical protein